MILRKAALLSAAMALASTPAAALPANAPSNGGTSHAPETTPAGPPSETPTYNGSNGAKNRSESGNANAGGSVRGRTSRGGASQGESRRSHSGSNHGSGHNGNRSSTRGRHNGSGSNGNGKSNRNRGASHMCKRPHRVAYVAAGKLVTDSLTENENHTYSGELTVEVKRTNHHARAVKGTTVTYTVEDVYVHGPVSVEALKPGDRVRLIGGITFLPRKCMSSEFSPTTTIRKLIFHPAPHQSEEATTEEGKAGEPNPEEVPAT